MRITEGIYHSESSDLLVEVLKVFNISDKRYVKFKANLVHKKYGYLYETKIYKLYLDNIKHWSRFYE